MEGIRDPDAFSAVADELAIRYVSIIAICLHKSPDVIFDLTDPEAEDSELLFDVCFKSAAQFEGQSGIDVNDTKYTPKIIFEGTQFDPLQSTLIDGGLVHAKIDDRQIVEGVARARQSNKGRLEHSDLHVSGELICTGEVERLLRGTSTRVMVN